MDLNDLVDYESGEADPVQTAAMFQRLINSGEAWRLQGSYGREAMSLIEAGWCVLGEVGHIDYWGGRVPSRYEVETGTKGSIEYAENLNPEFTL